MKIYLDDVRMTPAGWVRTYTPDETIRLLEKGGVEELSLDHDLGDDKGIGTGYDVVLWIERKVVTDDDFVPPRVIKVHSSNFPARLKMEAGIKMIERLTKGR